MFDEYRRKSSDEIDKNLLCDDATLSVPDDGGNKDPRLTSENNSKVEGTKKSESIIDVWISDNCFSI